MNITFNNTVMNTVELTANRQLNKEEAIKYAITELKKTGSYNNCTIGKVYINGKLILENVKL